jgi:hypothetical protein
MSCVYKMNNTVDRRTMPNYNFLTYTRSMRANFRETIESQVREKLPSDQYYCSISLSKRVPAMMH